MRARIPTPCALSSRLVRVRSPSNTSVCLPTTRSRVAELDSCFDRKKALQMAMELNPKDYNFRVPPAFLNAEGKYDIRPKLKTILAPVLLLQGRQELAGEANVCEAHSLIKNSTLAFIDKCGHMPWLEQPEQTWKIVDDFLAHLPCLQLRQRPASAPQ